MVLDIIEQIEKVCISPNSVCNFACRYCYFYNPENPIFPQKNLTEADIRTILDKIYDYSVKFNLKKKIKVIFVGSGEPLLSWKEISLAIEGYRSEGNHKKVKFYMVTNGSLLSDEIVRKMKELAIIPSVSLDGPPLIHNKNRFYSNGNPTFDAVMKGIKVLRRFNFRIIINPTITRELVDNIDLFFKFIAMEKFDKVIFGRMIDVPSFFPPISYDNFYKILEVIYNRQKIYNFKNIEIGNIEAFQKAVKGEPERVCTLIGSCCGAGTTNLIYLQKEVYPCGRMFNDKNWLLGEFDQNIEFFQEKMIKKLEKYETKCSSCDLRNVCIRDCILETSSYLYNCQTRKEFLRFMINELEK
ncbi:MAG: radical SAM protein [Patescibacteria group bacterium]|nr:radical SAM protein [Patescibacteria group bacterium]